MSKTKTITLTILIALLMLGCITTQIVEPTPGDGRSAPTAAGTPPAYNGSQPPNPRENEAGAVFDIPEDWQRSTTPTKTPTSVDVQKGRSNYQ